MSGSMLSLTRRGSQERSGEGVETEKGVGETSEVARDRRRLRERESERPTLLEPIKSEKESR
jgi:hypothetical protein